MSTKTDTVTTESKPKQTTNDSQPVSGSALGGQLNDEGFALLKSGDYIGAISTLQNALDAFESAGATGDITYAYTLYNLAKALRLNGQPDEAIPLLEQRLDLTSNQRGVVTQELVLAQQEAGVDSSGGTGPGNSGKPEKIKPPKKSDEESGGSGPSDNSSGGVGPG